MTSRSRSMAAKKAARTKGPTVRSRAGHKAVAGLPTGTVGHDAMSRQGREAAAARSPSERSNAARRAVRTKGPAMRRHGAQKAARTRARKS